MFILLKPVDKPLKTKANHWPWNLLPCASHKMSHCTAQHTRQIFDWLRALIKSIFSQLNRPIRMQNYDSKCMSKLNFGLFWTLCTAHNQAKIYLLRMLIVFHLGNDR